MFRPLLACQRPWSLSSSSRSNLKAEHKLADFPKQAAPAILASLKDNLPANVWCAPQLSGPADQIRTELQRSLVPALGERLAQNTEDTTWDALLRRAFPRHILNHRGKRETNAWKRGRLLPDTTVRRRRTRYVWVKPASMLSNKECPACGEACANAHERRTHYNQTHAVTGLHFTTIPTFQCNECLRHFSQRLGTGHTLMSHRSPTPDPRGSS